MRRLAITGLGWALAAAMSARGAAGGSPAPLRTLRVCADPNNMPFSNDKGEGIDNALARIVADALGARLEYTWLPQRRGFVRNTLDAGRCDVMMEAPTRYERAWTTRPYYRSSYVFLSRRGAPAPRSLDDPRLRALRIGVQVIGDDYANSPPAEELGRRGLTGNVVGFPVYGDYGKPSPLSAIADAVVAGRIDIAIVWGPLAGWYAKQSRIPLEVSPVPESGAPALPLSFEIAMAVRRGDARLRALLDQTIRSRRAAIRSALERFQVPLLSLHAEAP